MELSLEIATSASSASEEEEKDARAFTERRRIESSSFWEMAMSVAKASGDSGKEPKEEIAS